MIGEGADGNGHFCHLCLWIISFKPHMPYEIDTIVILFFKGTKLLREI